MKNNPFGLSADVVKKISDVILAHKNVEKVVLYGSRAKGNFKSGSDIDLTLLGDHLTTEELLKIENELEDLLLPYKIDLSVFHQIDNTSLIDHINRVGVEFK